MSNTVATKRLTRAEQVAHTIRDRIDRRQLTPGSSLPSVRAMAETTGFSKSTVVEAYDRLVADGIIRSRPGAGIVTFQHEAINQRGEVVCRCERAALIAGAPA